jgi:hypothetical protein
MAFDVIIAVLISITGDKEAAFSLGDGIEAQSIGKRPFAPIGGHGTVD